MPNKVENVNQLIFEAIRSKTVLELRYHGYSRLVEPHAYGLDKHDEPILRAYQVSGGSESGERSGWKLLKVDEIRSLHATGTRFVPRPDYRLNDEAMSLIFCQLE